MHETAEAFANETDVGKPTNDGNKCIYDYFLMCCSLSWKTLGEYLCCLPL